MHALRTLPILLACCAALVLGACRSDDVEGPPPDATALPEGTAPADAPDESPTDNTPTPPTDPDAPPPAP
ncbi:MAG TPA: hypothetical protein VFG18_02820 [Xanthomonadaceae bacterium]|nr:hypothetical protein [Xanthomonadaceae bacterium]